MAKIELKFNFYLQFLTYFFQIFRPIKLFSLRLTLFNDFIFVVCFSPLITLGDFLTLLETVPFIAGMISASFEKFIVKKTAH